MNLEKIEPVTYRIKRGGKPRPIFLLEYRERLIESEEEECLQEEDKEKREIEGEEMGDRNDPLQNTRRHPLLSQILN